MVENERKRNATQEATQLNAPHVPLLASGDIGLAITEPVHAIMARVLTSKANARVITHLGSFATKLRSGKRQYLEKTCQDMLGPYADQMPAGSDYVPDHITLLLRQRSFYARLAKDPAWRPHISVVGGEKVQAAVDTGKGVVFWVLPQEMTALLLRLVCCDENWQLHHLSHWMHGQSVSRIGIAIFNQRDCRTEDQFANRIVMDEKSTKSAMSQASALLKSGKAIGIRGIGWSTRPAYYTLLDGHIKLAFGAPVLARRTGARLFSVASSATERGFELRFDEMNVTNPLTLDEIGYGFVKRLEQAIIAAPSFWPASALQWAPGPAPEVIKWPRTGKAVTAPAPTQP